MFHRLLFTISTAACLTGLYAVYALVARPLIVIPEFPETSVGSRNGEQVHRPIENVRVAETYLSELKWAAKSQYTLHSGQSFIYTNEWHPEEGTPWITFAPFAMVWLTKDSEGREEAISLVSDQARLKFASTFNTITTEPGRVVGAVLDGVVQIKGPNGLAVVGRQFIFDESAQSLVSTYPVQFEYASHAGSGGSLNMALIPAEGLPGNDRPHVYGIRTIRLNAKQDPNNSKKFIRAKLDLKVPQEGQVKLVRIQCSSHLEVNIPSQTITFSTDVRADRRINRDDYDQLECDQLMVELEPPAPVTGAGSVVAPEATIGQRNDFQKFPKEMAFKRLTAIADNGRKVTVKSTQQHLRAEMEKLVFDAASHRVLLTRSSDVWISQKQSLLKVPEVEVVLSPDNSTLQEVFCKGIGRLDVSNEESKKVAFTATWRGFLRMSTDPDNGLRLIQLQHAASVLQQGQQTGLGAETIRMWMESGPLSTASATGTQGKSISAEPKPKRLVAEKNVALVSPKLMIEKCGELEIQIEDSKIPRELGGRSRPGIQQASGGKGDAFWPPIDIPDSSEAGESTTSHSQPIEVVADRICVKMENAEGESQPEMIEVETTGHVSVSQRDGSMTAKGDRLILENRGPDRQRVHLFGSPSHLRFRKSHVEGREVHLDQAANRVWVKGKGLLQVPIPRNSLPGDNGISSLTQGAKEPMLDVWWDESMEFDGRKAQFVGKVSAELGRNTMSCEQMDVNLTVPFSFSNATGTTPALKSIHCRESVAFQSSQYEGNRLVRIVRGTVAEFMHDHELGISSAKGPGQMKFLKRSDKGGVQRQQIQANRPISTDPEDWEYTRIKFKGRMTGNIAMSSKSTVASQASTFHDTIDIVHGPVALPSDEIQTDRLPKDALSMRCNVLEVTNHSMGPDNAKKFQQIFGRGNARVEGHNFFASADEISYDGFKDLFILRALGNQNATITYDSANGKRVESPGRRITFIPKLKQIDVSELSGATGP